MVVRRWEEWRYQRHDEATSLFKGKFSSYTRFDCTPRKALVAQRGGFALSPCRRSHQNDLILFAQCSLHPIQVTDVYAVNEYIEMPAKLTV